MALNANLSTSHNTHLFWCYQQTLHTSCCIAEQHWERLSVCVQTNICGMFEYFVRLSRHCYAACLLADGRGLLVEMMGVLRLRYIENPSFP